MLVGEWGAFWEDRVSGRGCGTQDQADQLQRIFEAFGCSDTFWCYPDGGLAHQNIDGFRYSEALVRGIPAAISGRLITYRWEPGTGVFMCEWDDDGRGTESRFWVPGRVLETYVMPESAWHVTQTVRGSHVSVAGRGAPGLHQIRIATAVR